MNELNETLKEDGKPTGRRYDSVKSMMQGEGVPEAIQKKVAEIVAGRTVGLHLAKMRTRAGLTQTEMAKRLEITQGAISKLEAAPDGEITLKDVEQYSMTCNERVTIGFGKRINHVEAVRLNALSIKEHLEALAKIANQDERLEKDISTFFEEALFNILRILASCSEKLPSGSSEYELKIEGMRPISFGSRTALGTRGVTMI